MFDVNDVNSLSDFQRHSRAHIERLRKSGRPQLLTINGKAAVVVQDARSYQRLLDRIDRADAIAAIQEGLDQVAAGKTRPAKDVLADLRRGPRNGRKK